MAVGFLEHDGRAARRGGRSGDGAAPEGRIDDRSGKLARRALAAIDPTTRVTVAGSTSIAGRDAYVLSLEPRTNATLVGRVELYVDASRWLPLGGAVFARGAPRPR